VSFPRLLPPLPLSKQRIPLTLATAKPSVRSQLVSPFVAGTLFPCGDFTLGFWFSARFSAALASFSLVRACRSPRVFLILRSDGGRLYFDPFFGLPTSTFSLLHRLRIDSPREALRQAVPFLFRRHTLSLPASFSPLRSK